jgi:hypothetical protein
MEVFITMQKGLLLSSRGFLCVEETVDLMGHLIETRDDVRLLYLLAIKLLLGVFKDIFVLQIRERRDSPHLSQSNLSRPSCYQYYESVPDHRAGSRLTCS